MNQPSHDPRVHRCPSFTPISLSPRPGRSRAGIVVAGFVAASFGIPSGTLAQTVIDMPPPPPPQAAAETSPPAGGAGLASGAGRSENSKVADPNDVASSAGDLTPGPLALRRYALAREGTRNEYFVTSFGRSPFHHRSFVITHMPWFWGGWPWWRSHWRHPGIVIGGPICWW